MPPKPIQQIYNVKGRQSTGGTRKKGKGVKKRRTKALGDTSDGEQQNQANADILVPKSKEDKERERKDKLLREEKKLKKEERVQIFEKLAQSQATLPSSLLQSSSTLGSGQPMSHLDRLQKEEDKETRKALDGRLGKRKRKTENFDVVSVGDEDSGDEVQDTMDVARDPDGDVDMKVPKKPRVPVVVADGVPPPRSVPEVGSALRKNPDGTVTQPKVRPRTGKQVSKKGWGFAKARQMEEDNSDSSFDSSDSAYDSESRSEGDSDDDEWGGIDENTSGNSDESESEAETDEDREPTPPSPKKKLGFKDWAQKQLSLAKSYVPPPVDEAQPEQFTEPPRKKAKRDPMNPPEMCGPLGRDLPLPTTTFGQHIMKQGSTTSSVKAVEIKRPEDVEAARILLPIVTEEQPIMEAIMLNPVVIICGETGSGKTTQVPQFLYEAGFGTPGSDNPGMIGVTQPRRVAAMSMASRVAHELSLTSSKVSYQIRYDATVSASTSIKFMTDGVLLRELATDFLLTKYSVIIIDEAHERSINTDILIGVLSRVIKLREERWREGKDGAKPLRLIIMSATLRVSDFAENKTLFQTPPPVISVGSRQHPVTVHFSRRTSPDYVGEAIKKAVKIHTRLPPGGILIFLTGQNEITGVCRKLEARFGEKVVNAKKQQRTAIANKAQEVFQTDERNVNPAQAAVEVEDMDLGVEDNQDLAADVDDGVGEEDPDALDTDDEDAVDDELGIGESDVPMHIVPLYSLLSSDKQMKVFEPPPLGTRLVVVATNVAETSLTIPGIRYVVDCGRAKERKYDVSSGVQSFHITWTSKASAQQRAGRAGRTGPGHCYRLYSSALFENYFEQFSKPEIQRMPIEGVVLQMKSMHIDAVVNFPFPTPPDRFTLQKAERVLVHLGALKTDATSSVSTAKITDLGKAMSLFPLAPRFSRMLISGQQHGCLPYVITVVSVLSVGDPFLFEDAILRSDGSNSDSGEDDGELCSVEEEKRRKRKSFFQSHALHSSLGKRTSDVFKALSVVGAYEYAGGGPKFCADHFVRLKAMDEIHKLRAQISNIVQVNFPASNPNFTSKLPPPSEFQLKVLRQLLTASFIDQVAVRKDRIETTDTSGTQFKTANGVPYRAIGIAEDVYVHSSSVLASESPPDYVIYNEVVQTGKPYMKVVTVINPAWLPKLGKSLCTFSKPLKNNAGQMVVIPRFGPSGWELPAIKAEDTV